MCPGFDPVVEEIFDEDEFHAIFEKGAFSGECFFTPLEEFDLMPTHPRFESVERWQAKRFAERLIEFEVRPTEKIFACENALLVERLSDHACHKELPVSHVWMQIQRVIHLHPNLGERKIALDVCEVHLPVFEADHLPDAAQAQIATNQLGQISMFTPAFDGELRQALVDVDVPSEIGEPVHDFEQIAIGSTSLNGVDENARRLFFGEAVRLNELFPARRREEFSVETFFVQSAVAPLHAVSAGDGEDVMSQRRDSEYDLHPGGKFDVLRDEGHERVGIAHVTLAHVRAAICDDEPACVVCRHRVLEVPPLSDAAQAMIPEGLLRSSEQACWIVCDGIIEPGEFKAVHALQFFIASEEPVAHEKLAQRPWQVLHPRRHDASSRLFASLLHNSAHGGDVWIGHSLDEVSINLQLSQALGIQELLQCAFHLEFRGLRWKEQQAAIRDGERCDQLRHRSDGVVVHRTPS